MSSKNDPAFPVGGEPMYSLGLTTLEWFAGMAIQLFSLEPKELTLIEKGEIPDHRLVAKFCFDLAEAMLAESERRR